MTNKFTHILFTLLFSLIGFSQVQEVNPPEDIKTIIFKSRTSEGQLPIMRLGDPLTLKFDVLNGEESDFYYIIEHYNYDWTPSQLAKSEYLSGFDNQRIMNYENSFNTYQIYSHYTLQVPNEYTRGILKSGNYLISIYHDSDELMFSRKFIIYEDMVNVGVDIKRSRDVRSIDAKQSVDIVISNPNFTFNNPTDNVKTLILQNNNFNTAIRNLKPQYTLGNQLIYKYTSESSFWGGNEYLYFENKDIRGANVGVQFIDLKDIYHNYLFVNEPRANRPYTYNPDINGNFLITMLDSDNVNIEADYAFTHFALKHPKLNDNQELYVYGNYNNYALTYENRMIYNSESGLYEVPMRMKQGFYNYKYVVVTDNKSLDEGAISGNFYQTENNYKVVVYYRDFGERYDRIIGLGEGSSLNISN